MFQTGGGCRASNYISLIRKALERARHGARPGDLLQLCAGMEKHPGFKLTLPTFCIGLLYAVLYGDLMMALKSIRCEPYENHRRSMRRRWRIAGRQRLGRRS